MTHELSRRTMLASTAAGTALLAGSLAGCTRAQPPSPAQPVDSPTFVLVGGNSEPSFFWTPVVRALSLAGLRSHPVELPGHGLEAPFSLDYQSPQDGRALAAERPDLGELHLTDFADRIVEVVDQVRRHGPVVLVGHSLGGAGITLAANAAADRIDHLVYVSAICCTARKSALEYITGPENADSLALPDSLPPNDLGDPAKSGVTYTNWRTRDREYLDAYRRAAIAEATDAQFLAMLNFCNQPMENAAASLEDARGQVASWGTIPRSFVRLTADRVIDVKAQDRMIADADELTPDNRFQVHDLEASHQGITLAAPELAAILQQIASTVAAA